MTIKWEVGSKRAGSLYGYRPLTGNQGNGFRSFDRGGDLKVSIGYSQILREEMMELEAKINEVEIDDVRERWMREDLSHLFDHHEYADGIGILAISEHVDEMSNLQRQIFEDCYPGNPSLSRLELNDRPDGRFSGDIQWIQRKLNLPLQLCSMLRDWFEGFELRHEDIVKIINDNVGKPWEFWNQIGTIFAQMPVIKDESMISQSYVEDGESDEDEWNVEEEEIETTPKEFKGIPIGLRMEDLNAIAKRDWFTNFWAFRAKKEFKDLWRKIGETKSNKDIARMKKDFYDNKPFTGVEMSLLWTKIKLQEKKVEMKTDKQMQILIDFIKKTRRGTSWIKDYIFALQRELKLDLSNKQWSIVWKTYKDRRNHEWFSSQCYVPYDELYCEEPI